MFGSAPPDRTGAGSQDRLRPGGAGVGQYGKLATVRESSREVATLFREVEEYFDAGATLGPGATVIDVGANIGAFAIAAAKRSGGQLALWCFEPVPELYVALEKNIFGNEWLAPGSHRAFNVALTTPDEADGTREFFYFRRFPRDSTMDLETKAG